MPEGRLPSSRANRNRRSPIALPAPSSTSDGASSAVDFTAVRLKPATDAISSPRGLTPARLRRVAV